MNINKRWILIQVDKRPSSLSRYRLADYIPWTLHTPRTWPPSFSLDARQADYIHWIHTPRTKTMYDQMRAALCSVTVYKLICYEINKQTI